MTAAFLYVLPCAYEDLLKLGHSRDPLRRMHELNSRYYEFFDLDRAFLVGTETVREARALETRYHRLLDEHAAPAPLLVDDRAGFTEWYRGAYARLDAIGAELEREGYRVSRSLRPWLRERLAATLPLLYDFAATLTPEELALRGDAARGSAALRRAADLLDAFRAMDLEIADWLPAPVLAWHRG
jgi:hypothetical protein